MEKIKLVIPDGYEFFGIDDDNKVVLTKKQSQYPKTYDECCATLGHDVGRVISFDTQTCKTDTLFENFYELYICRNAYWKIVGEEMGLGKPWKPDWNNVCDKYTIYVVYGNEIWRDKRQTINTILAFPTAEMRDAFYENFKELIEECKELL